MKPKRNKFEWFRIRIQNRNTASQGLFYYTSTKCLNLSSQARSKFIR